MRGLLGGLGLSHSCRRVRVDQGGKCRKVPASRAKRSRALFFEPLEGRRLLSISGLSSQAVWLANLTSDEQNDFYEGAGEIEWSESTDSGVDGRLVLSGVLFDAISAEGLDFTSLNVPGWGLTTDVGIAELPVFSTWLTIPSGATVTASSRAEVMTSLGRNHLVYPAQEPMPNSDVADGPFAYDTAYYAGDSIPATSLLTVSETMIARGTSMVLVTVSPFRYNPALGEIIVATDVTLSFDFEIPEADAADGEDDGYDGFGEADGVSAAAQADYLIIAADRFVTQVQPLAEWKHMKGFKTYVAPFSEVGTTYTDVFAYISAAYHSGPKTSYVLIVGDHEDVEDVDDPEVVLDETSDADTDVRESPDDEERKAGTKDSPLKSVRSLFSKFKKK